MGFRYGFWRTKLVKKHRKRASLREFLPWFGLLITVTIILYGPRFLVPARDAIPDCIEDLKDLRF